MVRDVATLGPDATVGDIADLMRRRSIKRVPIVEKGKLVGIVGRADIVRLVAMRAGSRSPAVSRSDREIQNDLFARLDNEPWAPRQFLSLDVKDGVVELSGIATSAAEKKAVAVLARKVAGVKGVVNGVKVMPAQISGVV